MNQGAGIIANIPLREFRTFPRVERLPPSMSIFQEEIIIFSFATIQYPVATNTDTQIFAIESTRSMTFL
jgi:hypothetical protein